MNYPTWEPVYEAILDDFGYDRAADVAARDDLADMASVFDLRRVVTEGQHVAIAAHGPSLVDELSTARDADLVFAASSAARTLRAHDVGVDCMITDLDGAPETARALTREGVPVVVHAHGDNRDLLGAWVPEFERRHVLGTTQAEPRGPVHNFGGFTDGDRAAFLADHFGATTLSFPGWDLDDPDVDSMKARKLAWAARLLAWLERRRGERFALLDGRREDLDLVPGE